MSAKDINDYLDKPFDFILDESKVRNYELPELLADDQGNAIENVEQWEKHKPELLAKFKNEIYGEIPTDFDDVRFETLSEGTAFNGKAIHRIVTVTIERKGKMFSFNLNMYLPANKTKVPAFMFINNRHETAEFNPYDPNDEFWSVEKIIDNGFATTEMNNKTLAPDDKDEFQNGVMQLYPELLGKDNGWGAISAWAFGGQRCVDYLMQCDEIDSGKIIAIGHSRGGKTALWATVNDPRIAMVCVNNSGCTGTAIARRKEGETVETINNLFPHWFNTNYKKYNDKEDELPVDQHMLVALVAPRVISIGSAIHDAWADPKGEYLSLIHATPVFELYGKKGLSEDLNVVLNKNTIGDGMSYHITEAEHSLSSNAWDCYIETAKKMLK